MSMIEMTLESQYLHGNTQITVFLPDCPRDKNAEEFYNSGEKYQVLWLLHGTFGDHTDWMRRTMLEVYARERQLICVMPSGLNADYTNWEHFAAGFDMENYLVKELMPMIQNWFPASAKCEDNFITGLSMGGAGALKYILNYPDKFAAAAILSWIPVNYDAMENAENPFDLGGDGMRWRNQIENRGGFEKFRNSTENSWRQMIQLSEAGKLPRLYFSLGLEDFLVGFYQPFHDMCTKKGMDIVFEVVPGFGHEWRFWDSALEKVMDFCGIPKSSDANAWRGLKSERNFFVKEIAQGSEVRVLKQM